MNDDLSRLLAGELPEAEAEALRQRIAQDPELARVWAAMSSLPGRLAALPREMTPPPLRTPLATAPEALAPAAPLAAPPPAAQRRPTLPFLVAGLALAAAMALWIALPPVGEQRVAAGLATFEGELQLLAGDVAVEVDGKIWVRVEPPPGVSRETLAETPTMDKTHFLAALAGSVVTLAVLEGTAVARPLDAAPISLLAGESRQVGTGKPSAPPDRTAASVVDSVAYKRVIDELAALKLEHALTVGQLRALGGTPSAWPDNLPAPYRPDAFAAFVKARAALVPGASVVAMDCDEYPCIAVIQSHDPSEAWQDNLMPLHDDLGETAFGHGTNVIGFGSVHDDGEAAVQLYAFSIVPGDEGGIDPDVRSRLDVRVRGDLEGLSEELRAEPLEAAGYLE